jgi:hypothetical protein
MDPTFAPFRERDMGVMTGARVRSPEQGGQDLKRFDILIEIKIIIS